MEQRKLIIFVLILIAGLALWYVFLYQPKQAELVRLKAELSEVLGKVKNARHAKLDLKNIENRLKTVQSKLDKEKARFIKRDELSVVTSKMQELAGNMNLKLVDFSPGFSDYFSETDQARIKELSLDITVVGAYLDIGRFIEQMESLPFYLTPEEVNIERDQDHKGLLTATVKSKLYTWNE